MYLTYSEYVDMGGQLTEAAFNEYDFEAETRINYITFGRLKNETVVSPDVKKCVYALIGMIEKQAVLLGASADSTGTTGGGIIASRSNDGVSESYNIVSASEVLKTIQSGIDSTIKRYLDDVRDSLGRRVLYRGIYAGE